MSFLFNEFVYRPIYNLLILVYNIVPFSDFGIAIIIVTLIIKFALIPLSRKQIESQKKMQELQPKIKEIQEKHKKDKEKQSQALMAFYKTNKANPFSGCLPTILQLVFLLAIYRVLFNISQAGLRVESDILYPIVSNPGQISHYFLGIIDLANKINFSNFTGGMVLQIILVLCAATAQYFQIKMISPQVKSEKKKEKGTPGFSQTMTKQMTYLGPLLTLFIGVRFPIGLSLYWLVSTVFAIIQQKKVLKVKEVTDVKK